MPAPPFNWLGTQETLDVCLPFLHLISLGYSAGSPLPPELKSLRPVTICFYSPKVETATSGAEIAPGFLSGPTLETLCALFPLQLTSQLALGEKGPV